MVSLWILLGCSCETWNSFSFSSRLLKLSTDSVGSQAKNFSFQFSGTPHSLRKSENTCLLFSSTSVCRKYDGYPCTKYFDPSFLALTLTFHQGSTNGKRPTTSYSFLVLNSCIITESLKRKTNPVLIDSHKN